SYTVTLYPVVSGLSITTNNVAGTLSLGGTRNLVIDGRVNQTGNKNLVISNTHGTGTNTHFTIRLINDASNNTLRHCTIRCGTTAATSGTIVLGASDTGSGNDNNTIEYCDILDGNSTHRNAIYSAGTATSGKENSGNIISNCNIANY